jgi:hypothetical protein
MGKPGKASLKQEVAEAVEEKEESGRYLGYTFRGQKIRASVTLSIFIGVLWVFIRANISANGVPEA